MRNMDHIELHRGGREEAFPETAEDWPYIAERAEFARYPGNSVPWHWHSEVELFYMEQGAIDYRTRAAERATRWTGDNVRAKTRSVRAVPEGRGEATAGGAPLNEGDPASGPSSYGNEIPIAWSRRSSPPCRVG